MVSAACVCVSWWLASLMDSLVVFTIFKGLTGCLRGDEKQEREISTTAQSFQSQQALASIADSTIQAVHNVIDGTRAKKV